MIASKHMTLGTAQHGTPFSSDGGPDLAAALTELLRHLPVAPRLLGFGEPLHGEQRFLRLRNQMFHHLVEHAGYRSIAIESSCLGGLLVDALVDGGDGSVDEVMTTGFSHTFGEYAANRDLVEWLVTYNRGRSPQDRVRFYGFDAPMETMGAESPRRSLYALDTYLSTTLDPDDLPCTIAELDALLGDDARWSNPAGAMDPTQSIGASADAIRLRRLTDDLVLLLRMEAPRLHAANSPDQRWLAELHARTAVGLLDYHAVMATDNARRIPRLLGVRDLMMADNLCAIVEREADRGPTFAFAHNGHLQKGESQWTMGEHQLHWWCAGGHLDGRLGDAYRVIGSAIGTAHHHTIAEPEPASLEGELYAATTGNVLIATDALPNGPRERRTSANYAYIPLETTSLTELDAIVFVRDIEPVQAD